MLISTKAVRVRVLTETYVKILLLLAERPATALDVEKKGIAVPTFKAFVAFAKHHGLADAHKLPGERTHVYMLSERGKRVVELSLKAAELEKRISAELDAGEKDTLAEASKLKRLLGGGQ